jgi:hypothetical protein
VLVALKATLIPEWSVIIAVALLFNDGKLAAR